MQFIKFCIALKSHGILNNLNFLLDNNNETETNHNIDRGIEEVKIAENECDLPLIRLMSNDINNI